MKNKTVMRINYTDYKRITEHLTQAGEDESFIYALFSRAKLDNITLYLCNRVLIPDEKQLQNQSAVSIEPSSEYQAIAYGLAYELGLSIIDIHTHPFSCQAMFSPIDDFHGKHNAEYISSHFEEASTMGMIVFGNGFDNFEARIWNRNKACFEPVHRIEILGSPTLILSDQGKAINCVQDDLYARHKIIPGWNQITLEDIKVFVCGLGGNGAVVFDSLLALGIGRRNGWIKACDPDTFEISNVPRIPYGYPNEVGLPKSELAQLHADCKAPQSNVTCYVNTIASKAMQQYAKEANLIIGTVDNDGARMILNGLAARYLVPYFDVGTEIVPENDHYQAIGQVQVFIPGKTGCLMCSSAIDPSEAAMQTLSSEVQADYTKAGYVRGTQDSPTPSILHLNGVISHLAISQMLRMLFGDGFEGKEFVHYDRQKVQLLAALVCLDDACPVCGIQGYVGNGDEDIRVLDGLAIQCTDSILAASKTSQTKPIVSMSMKIERKTQ